MKVYTPPGLQGFNGEIETQGNVRIRRQFVTSGTEIERFVFRRNYEQICGILMSLEEINCNGSVDCSFDNGAFEVHGIVTVWFPPAANTVAQALRNLNDLGWQAARISQGSAAHIHALIAKTALRKVA
jgi:hypothetical protein